MFKNMFEKVIIVLDLLCVTKFIDLNFYATSVANLGFWRIVPTIAL